MKIIFSILLIFVTLGCQTISQTESQHNKQEIINLKNEFASFWSKAKGQPLDYQIRLWDEIIEKNHKDFFNSLAWSKKDRSDWENRV